MNILEVQNISLSFDNNEVLKNYSLTLEEGEHIALMGASGVGKTTLLRAIAGLDKSYSGNIIFSGRKISYQFQEPRLVPDMNVLENVLLVMGGGKTPENKKRALQLLQQAGLQDAIDKLPAELSGGMQKRVSLVRALVFGGDLFLFDEPFESLDSDTAAKMLELIKEETQEASVILITHSTDLAGAFCSRTEKI